MRTVWLRACHSMVFLQTSPWAMLMLDSNQGIQFFVLRILFRRSMQMTKWICCWWGTERLSSKNFGTIGRSCSPSIRYIPTIKIEQGNAFLYRYILMRALHWRRKRSWSYRPKLWLGKELAKEKALQPFQGAILLGAPSQHGTFGVWCWHVSTRRKPSQKRSPRPTEIRCRS